MSATITARPITPRPITARPITPRPIGVPGEPPVVGSAGHRRSPNDVARCSAAAPRVSASTYRRRRAVVGIVLAVLVAAGAVLAHDVLAGSGGDPASAAESQPARARSTVTARPGDTLWAIAGRHHGEIPISRYVDALVDLNGGASIQAGQAVVLP